MSWLEESLLQDLPEETFDYLLGRGVSRNLIDKYGFSIWECETTSPSHSFRSKYGEQGEKFVDRLLVPLYSPKGLLIGVEARTMGGEAVKALRFLLPRAAWNPIFVGMSFEQTNKLWKGADLWLVEGIFDLTSMQGLLGDKVVVLGTLRASVTQKHLDYIQRFVSGSVYVAYDNDITGKNAMYGFKDSKNRYQLGVVDKIQKLGVSCHPVRYRGGKDPNEIWEKGGDTALREAFIGYL